MVREGQRIVNCFLNSRCLKYLRLSLSSTKEMWRNPKRLKIIIHAKSDETNEMTFKEANIAPNKKQFAISQYLAILS